MPPPSQSAASFERVFAATAYFEPNKRVGNEVYGDCPICGGADKFYVNSTTGQWSCKAGKPEHVKAHASGAQAGNVYTWLEVWCDSLFREFDSEAPWRALAKDRGIPVEALQEGGLVWDSQRWLLPIYNEKGTTVALYQYPVLRNGKKEMWNVDGTKHFIYGVDRLKEFPPNSTIYVCEGFWDAAVLQAELDHYEIKAIALGIFGASVLKKEWISYFAGHPVVVCYDNDLAGQRGAEKILNTLISVCTDLKQVVWPDDKPSGFDIRDHFKGGDSLDDLLSWVTAPIGEIAENEPAVAFNKPFGNLSFEKDVLPVFRAWLHLTEDIEVSIRIAFAVILSNQVHGEPLWVEIVAPPGGGKTEVLRATGEVSNTYFLSTLKPAMLVSGFANGDPSLLPKLRKKTLVIKDLTTLVAAPDNVKREVFGILRDAYDGEADYQYGNNSIRHYENIWFSMLAGVTPTIFADPDAALGGRFLVYHSIKGADFDDDMFVMQAARGGGNQAEMRLALSEISKEYLESRLDETQVPEIPQDAVRKIAYLARLTAKLRGVVERDKYNKDILKYPAQHELGTRLVQQLLRLAQFLSLLEEDKQFNSHVYGIIKRVAMDTCNAFDLAIAKLLVKDPKGLTIDDIKEQSGLPHATVMARLDDMRRLKSVESVNLGVLAGTRVSSRMLYKASEPIQLFWKEAAIENKNGHKPHVNIKDAKPMVKVKLRR